MSKHIQNYILLLQTQQLITLFQYERIAELKEQWKKS